MRVSDPFWTRSIPDPHIRHMGVWNRHSNIPSASSLQWSHLPYSGRGTISGTCIHTWGQAPALGHASYAYGFILGEQVTLSYSTVSRFVAMLLRSGFGPFGPFWEILDLGWSRGVSRTPP